MHGASTWQTGGSSHVPLAQLPSIASPPLLLPYCHLWGLEVQRASLSTRLPCCRSYHQMAGRAGRPMGHAEVGEAYLVHLDRQRPPVEYLQRLLRSTVDDGVDSRLAQDGYRGGTGLGGG